MPGKSLLEELKEMCTKIVGHWYCEELKQHFIFDFNDKPLQQARLVVVTSKTFETEYGIGTRISSAPNIDKNIFYFDVGRFEKRYYEILSLTKDLLIISEYFMLPDYPTLPPLIYKRQTDLTQADDILGKVDFMV